MIQLTALIVGALTLFTFPAFGFNCAVIVGHLMATHDLEETELQVLQDLAEESRRVTVRDLIRLKREETQIWRDQATGKNRNCELDLEQRRREEVEVLTRDCGEADIPAFVAQDGERYLRRPHLMEIVARPELSPWADNPNFFHRITYEGPITDPNFNNFGEDIEGDYWISDLVTQGQWALVFGYNPSFYSDRGLFVVQRDRIPTLVDAHLPVDSVSYASAIVFANKVSRLEGRVPAYDLEGIHFQAANGLIISATELEPLEDAAATGTLHWTGRPRRVPGANGYRLPRETEFFYSLRERFPPAFCNFQSRNTRIACFVHEESKVSDLSREGQWFDWSPGLEFIYPPWGAVNYLSRGGPVIRAKWLVRLVRSAND